MFERLRASDVSALRIAHAAEHGTDRAQSDPHFPAVIDELAERHGDKLALLSDRERFSYRELAERSRRYTRWALAQGIAKGDVVGAADAEPARSISRSGSALTRAGGDRRAAQHQPHRCFARLLHRHRRAQARDRRGRARRRARFAAGFRKTSPRVWLMASAARTPAAVPASTTPSRRSTAGRSRPRSSSRSPSRTRRCSSTPPARPACRRPRTSTTTG